MKTVLITGVCGGVGRALAAHMQSVGWTVFGTDINECPSGLKVAKFWRGNVAEEDFWVKTIKPEVQDLGSMDGLVNNAATQPCSGIVEMNLEQWNETLAVNLTGAFLGIRTLVPFMEGRSAAIVNVSSVHAISTSAGMADYVTSKGGLLALTRAAALEFASSDIRVNAILPGAVDTPMLDDGLKRSSNNLAKAKEALIERTALKRLANPDEIAKAIEFLLDGRQSSFMTGQSLTIDGGVLAKLSSE